MPQPGASRGQPYLDPQRLLGQLQSLRVTDAPDRPCHRRRHGPARARRHAHIPEADATRAPDGTLQAQGGLAATAGDVTLQAQLAGTMARRAAGCTSACPR